MSVTKEREILEKIFDYIPVMIKFVGPDGRLILVNREWERTFGWSLEEVRNQTLGFLDELFPEQEERDRVKEFISGSKGEWAEFKPQLRDGRVIHTTWSVIHLSDGSFISIGRDISEQKRAEEDLRRSHEQLRALRARLESQREEERIRMAREIHDELGQQLTGLKMDLVWLERKMAELGSSRAVNTLLDRVVSATELTDEILRSVQEVASDLRPCVLDKLGLGAALQFEARRFQERSGTPCEVRLPDTEPALSSAMSTGLYRICQECLTNVARHAGATRVRIDFEVAGGFIEMRVEDNGRGITEQEIHNPASLGILGMKERAALLGGEIFFRPRASGGTIVTSRVPQIRAGAAAQPKNPP